MPVKSICFSFSAFNHLTDQSANNDFVSPEKLEFQIFADNFKRLG